MGGSGSGDWHRWDKRATLEDYPKLDINSLHRNGTLTRGYSGDVTWSRGSQVMSSIQISGHGSYVRLMYRRSSASSGEKEVDQRVDLTFTRCHYGGTRPWFSCPGCGSRVGVLVVAGELFACRQCYGLPYYTQQCGDIDRLIHKLHKLEARRDRRGLHEPTRERLRAQCDELDIQFDWEMNKRFGSMF